MIDCFHQDSKWGPCYTCCLMNPDAVELLQHQFTLYKTSEFYNGLRDFDVCECGKFRWHHNPNSKELL